MIKHLPIIAFILLLSLISCKNEIVNTTIENYPDISLKNAKYLLGREDGDNVMFNAEEMNIFLKEKNAKLSHVSFEQKKDSNGELFVSGKADNADINTETLLSALSGNVMIILHEGNNSITAENINWNKDTQNVESSGRVELKYDDISIDGVDLTGNLQSGVFTFSKIKKGLIKGNAKSEEQKDDK